ncbi:L,D-transpeptidase family protein [Aquisalimonas asiatica]|uniref:L,D-transpeptidase ErfK/SrfK n=1 Tax=Aquisalimonas asiatica TaxID=406100 RepID=A0A1H8QGU0_9GAMM|nr:L,D-transpeptidase family protein [Aquisalimonas asiatica]SEO53258.1 L,D-transpeptidase ErfK/SrfK [Aquisalimonas asiatica]
MVSGRALSQWMVALALCSLLSGPAVSDDTLEGDSVGESDAERDDDADRISNDRNVYELPDADVDVVGEVKTVMARREDTLLSIARQHGVGYEEIRRANPGVDVWLPGEGTPVTIPTRFVLPPGPREGIVVNLPEMRMYYYPEPDADGNRVVETYPISIGRMDWSTPIGETEVTMRLEDPAWFPPQSVRERAESEGRALPRRVDPGPDNPLGRYAIGLDVPGYFIHGTNRPAGVGMRATHGCIRMFPEDIESIVYRVNRGTNVRILNQPFKAGWSEAGDLYLQAYPSLDEDEDELAQKGVTPVVEVVAERLRERAARVDYPRLKEVAAEASGRPKSITRESASEELAKAD